MLPLLRRISGKEEEEEEEEEEDYSGHYHPLQEEESKDENKSNGNNHYSENLWENEEENNDSPHRELYIFFIPIGNLTHIIEQIDGTHPNFEFQFSRSPSINLGMEINPEFNDVERDQVESSHIVALEPHIESISTFLALKNQIKSRTELTQKSSASMHCLIVS